MFYDLLVHVDLPDESRFVMALGNINNYLAALNGEPCTVVLLANGGAASFLAEKAKFLHNLLIIFVLDTAYRTNLHQFGARRECGRRSTLGRGESVCVKNTCGGNIFVPKLRSYCGDVHAS